MSSGVKLASLDLLPGDVAREIARGEGRPASSTDFARAFNGGPYAANTLSGDMKSYIDTSRGFTAAHVAGVGNYLHGLGINAPEYAGYFLGSSEAARNAIREHISKGTKITDEHVKNPNDVKAIMGAIKAGKMKSEDAPPSVQKIMKDMKDKGIDPATADPKVLDKYFEDNPKALEQYKKANDATIATHGTRLTIKLRLPRPIRR